MKFNSFIKECSEREVFKRLSIYVVTAWILIQVLSVVYEPLALPESAVSILLILLLIGFPFYIYFIWYTKLSQLKYQEEYLTRKGLKRHSSFRNTYFSFMGVIGFICIAFAFYITKNTFGSKPVTLSSFAATDKIGIMDFNNNTGEASLDVVGKMASDWITHGITENSENQVISPEIVNDYVSIIKASSTNLDYAGILRQYFKPGRVILGSYFLSGNTLVFRASITDGDLDKTLYSFKPIECDKSNPLNCVEQLNNKILGYLEIKKRGALNIEATPPDFKAYEYFLEATTRPGISTDLHIELLNKAIEEDSTYFEPKLFRIAHYYNSSEYEVADSLLRVLKKHPASTDRQQNLVNHYEALLDGNNKKVFETIMKEYRYTPQHLTTNYSALVIAVNFVNRPLAADTIYEVITMDDIDMDDCTECLYRIYMKSLADLNRVMSKDVINRLRPLVRDVDYSPLRKLLVAAYVDMQSLEELEKFLNQQEIELTRKELLELYLFTGKRLLLNGQEQLAANYFGKLTSEKYPEAYPETVSQAYYYLRDYENAIPLYKKIFQEDSTNTSIIGELAGLYKLSGDVEQSTRAINKLNGLKADYQYGDIDYQLAKYYAYSNNESQSLQYLLRSIAAGNFYSTEQFNNDPHFRNYQNNPKFHDIMTYWH